MELGTSCSISTLNLYGSGFRSGAKVLLAGETDGLAYDFTDQSAYIVDTTTPANNYFSRGALANGSLAGPGGSLTYSSPSAKLCLQNDGYYKYQAHNKWTYSEDFTTGAYTEVRATIVDGAIAGPNGENACKLVEDATASNNHQMNAAILGQGYGQFAFSISLKAAERRYAYVRLLISANGTGVPCDIIVDLQEGTITDSSGNEDSYSIVSEGNGWYRVTVVGTSLTGTQNNCTLYTWTQNFHTANPTYTGDGVSGIYTTKWQFYQYPAVTDYVKTTSAIKFDLPYSYDTTGNREGLFVEEARTNTATYSRDFWDNGSGGTPSGTASQNAVGIDGVANTAFTLTAGASNDAFDKYTALNRSQSATNKTTISCYVKRGSGTGAVYIPFDGHYGWISDGSETTTGSELLTNGTFTGSMTGWSTESTDASNTVTYNSNAVDIVSADDAVNPVLYQIFNTTIGKTYLVTLTISNVARTNGYFDIVSNYGAGRSGATSNGTYSVLMYAFSTTQSIRIVGNADISFTVDNVTAKETTIDNDISGSISTDAWTRITRTHYTGTGSDFMVQLATSGDSIIIDQIQSEVGNFASSPIITYPSSATRAADNISIATTAFPWLNTAASAYAQFTANGFNSTAGQFVFCMDGGLDFDLIAPDGDNDIRPRVGTSNLVLDSDYTETTSRKVAFSYNSTNTTLSAIIDGATQVYNFAVAADPSSSGTFYVGSRAGAAVFNGVIEKISYVPRVKDDIELAIETGYSLPASHYSYGAWDLFGTESSALAFDFTDKSIVNTKTPLVQQGDFSSGTAVGPQAALTYTSPSLKMCLQSDGYYKYGAHNVLVFSEDMSNWTNLNTTDSGTLITATATSGAHYMYRPNLGVTTNGTKYLFIARVSAGTHNYVTVTFYNQAGHVASVTVDLSDGTVGETYVPGANVTLDDYSIAAVGDGSYDVTLEVTAVIGMGSGAGGLISFAEAKTGNTYLTNGCPTWTPAGTETINIHRAQVNLLPCVTDYVKTTSAAVYGLPYTYDSAGTLEGILCEEERTNAVTYSTGFAASPWLRANCTAATGITSPAGTTDAVSFTPAAGTNNVEFYSRSSVATTASQTYTYSVYAKIAGVTDWLELTLVSGTVYRTWFDLTNGVKGTSSGSPTDYNIEDVGDGWYRISVTALVTGTTVSLYLSQRPSNGSLANITADGATVGGYAWQAQLEIGALPSSPIITGTATATRAADNISIATSAFPFSATAGTLYAHHSTAPVAKSTNVALNLSDGTANERFTLSYNTGQSQWAVVDGGVVQANLDAVGGHVADTVYKRSGAYAANDFEQYINGSAVGTLDTSGTLPTVTTLRLGSFTAAGYEICGVMKAVVYAPRRKTAAELETDTTL